MIENVEIHNYRGLRNVRVSLAQLTVLIGPNNSGKTSFLQAIYEAGTARKPNREIAIADHWRRNGQNVIAMQIGTTGVASVGKTNPNKPLYKTTIAGLDFTPIEFFRLPYDVKVSANGFAESATAVDFRLGSKGENVAAMVDFMLRRSRDRFDAMEAEARVLIPGLQSLRVSTPQAQARRLDLVMEDGWVMPADHASSGVRLLLFFLTLTHRPDPPKTILIEEPENGIHPLRLESVMRMLIRLTESSEGPQIILSTHSPYLLDCLTLGKHGVLVFSRDSEGGCTAREVDAERLKPFLTEFMLGEVWMNQGEKELVAERSDE